MLLLEDFVYFSVLYGVILDSEDRHQIHMDRVSEKLSVSGPVAITPLGHFKSKFWLLIQRLGNRWQVFVENAVGMFLPVEVVKNMESVFVHFKLLVLPQQVGRMFTENSFLSFRIAFLFLNHALLDVQVRAEEVFTVFFFFVTWLRTLTLKEFYCLVVGVTGFLHIFKIAWRCSFSHELLRQMLAVLVQALALDEAAHAMIVD